ncbi:MAG: serine/threonine protein phosphatase [Clostridia bacterium]|nr:serine/threonine protein phosphatase [Clostridia bacterium]
MCSVQTGHTQNPFAFLESCSAFGRQQLRLYSALRDAVPIIDAAIMKLVRLTGGFCIRCTDSAAQETLDRFFDSVNVNGNSLGLESFVSSYFEQLLTYGTAIGEIVTDSTGLPVALFNAPLENIELKRNANGIDIDIFTVCSGTPQKIRYPELVIMSTLNPKPGELCGNSLLSGLPFVAQTLMQIFRTTGTNWERLGNTRFAVTYKPANDALDKAYAKERAMQVAKEWSSAMSSESVRDFVAVGDIQIKAIGSETQIPDSEIPVRQLLEQIVSKTGLPPFLLGLSWSSTERMSSQQADALTSELEAYRRILTPAITRLADTCLRLFGLSGGTQVIWDDIMLQDMVELSRAELYSAQALKLTKEE